MAPLDEPTSRRWLPLATFLAVFAAIVLVGLVVVPVGIRTVERQYLVLQADVNARQARALGHFVDGRLMAGASEAEVIREFQGVIANSDTDRGFSCLIDRETSRFLSHPVEAVVGKRVARSASFASFSDAAPPRSWEGFLAAGTDAGGLLELPGDRREVVYMLTVPRTSWTITTHENTARLRAELAVVRRTLVLGSFVVGLLIAVPASFAARRVSRRYEATIEERNQVIREEREKSERLLLNILPPAVAEKLKAGQGTIAERHPDVTVLFADLVGFTPLASAMPAEEVVKLLNRIFSDFDDLALKHRLEKIKTIGDAYMVCGGLVAGDLGAAERVAAMAQDMLAAVRGIDRELGLGLSVRIGLHTGEVVAGVIGKQKFSYDLWGDVVNTASRMESSGEPGRIQLSDAVRRRLGRRFALEDRGLAEVKGKGALRTWWLLERP